MARIFQKPQSHHSGLVSTRSVEGTAGSGTQYAKSLWEAGDGGSFHIPAFLC